MWLFTDYICVKRDSPTPPEPLFVHKCVCRSVSGSCSLLFYLPSRMTRDFLKSKMCKAAQSIHLKLFVPASVGVPWATLRNFSSCIRACLCVCVSAHWVIHPWGVFQRNLQIRRFLLGLNCSCFAPPESRVNIGFLHLRGLRRRLWSLQPAQIAFYIPETIRLDTVLVSNKCCVYFQLSATFLCIPYYWPCN